MRRAAAVLGAFAILVPLHLEGQAAAQAAAPPSVTETTLELEDGSVLRYAVSVPDGYDGSEDDPRPLVLVLHPGGRSVYYGSLFMQSIVEPALGSFGAVMVAPDVPDRSWATPRSETALLQLIEHAMEQHPIDPERVLVTGFSMGGRGTWFMAAGHPELFTGAIVMAGSPNGTEAQSTADVPLYLIHSPDDEVMPYAPVQEAYIERAGLDHPIELRVLPGRSHYMMGAYVPALRVAGEWILSHWLEGAP
jgi:predicted peptidase